MNIIYNNPNKIKIPYLQLSFEVDKLYSKQFDENDTDSIDEHCEFISEFIDACGWDPDDYIRNM